MFVQNPMYNEMKYENLQSKLCLNIFSIRDFKVGCQLENGGRFS